MYIYVYMYICIYMYISKCVQIYTCEREEERLCVCASTMRDLTSSTNRTTHFPSASQRSDCSARITSPGTVTSPNYPSNYPYGESFHSDGMHRILV